MEIRFKLNPKNEKDKVIINLLSGEYSPSDTIKNILYKMATNEEECQRAVVVEQEYIGVASSRMEMNPTLVNRWDEQNCPSDDKKCKVMLDKDIANYFCNESIE